jgi:hypothetical protein
MKQAEKRFLPAAAYMKTPSIANGKMKICNDTGLI